jgi:opacity protein-like surface antigen
MALSFLFPGISHMKKRLPLTLACLLLGTAMGSAMATELAPSSNFYLGGSLGGSGMRLDSTKAATPAGRDKEDKVAAAFKLYGGYRLTEHFGVEAGYARLGRINQWTQGLNGATQQSATGQAFYAAATARLPLNEAFALHARLGVARGKVSGREALVPANQRVDGSATGAMVGFGAEYRFHQNFSLTADYDHFGKLSKNAKGGMLTVGLRSYF